MGDIRTCVVCGQPIAGTRRKYCSGRCYLIKNAQKSGWRSYETDHEKVRAQEARHHLSQKKLSEINRLARESGLTYGQYVARMNAPVIHKSMSKGK